MSEIRIIFRGEGGRMLTWDEVKAVKGVYKYEAVGGQPVPQQASVFHEQGRQLASLGDYQLAKYLFERASRLAPHWPYPIYDQAFSCLLQGEWEEAERLYARVDEMAPRGFYTVQAALDHLRREREGTIPRGTYVSLVRLEFESDNPKRIDALRSILAVTPEVPRAWEMLAALEPDRDAKLHAISEGLQWDPDPMTRGMLLIIKAQVLESLHRREEAINILGGVATDPDSPIFTEQLAKLILGDLFEVG